ncbi:C-type mannose receptor 2 isoform X1 [Polypterus senegalus]|uniref:C-type mannose receptor 2 isoform X1 n=1 Tax=Polypterus senegalus TaxID=55291 RepID=UPI001965D155|nr:C-type mannose receptor 2 isoform X1 [Polypterus senegalus]
MRSRGQYAFACACWGCAVLCALVGASDSGVFLIYNDGMQGCLEARDSSVSLSRTCNASAGAQQWKWVSRNRLFNLGTAQCLGVSGSNSTSGPLGLYRCDKESANMRWSCGTLGDVLTQTISLPSANGSFSPPERGDKGHGSQWRIFDSSQDLCAKPYQEIYTIQGNSHGKPCTIPFKYDNLWFHDCTSTGREDGHLWCATTMDYGKDERWGFCPVQGSGCEAFWDKDLVTGSCYQFNFQSTLSWSEARVSCQQQGAELLSINEIHEQTYINGLLTGYSSSLWIGLNDLDINGGWQWADNSPLKYLNWEADQPDNTEEENCAIIRTESSGRWQNKDCGIALPYVCKKKPNATLDPFHTDSWADQKTECDGAWQQFQSSCYYLNTQKLNWQDARKNCLTMASDLVSIHTLPELEFIIKNMKQGVDELWIGLSDAKQQMNFEWADHTPVLFTYWHPFEPNNFRNNQEDCVTMWGPEGRWNDSPCNMSLPSICKKSGRQSDKGEEEHGCKKGWKWHSPSCYQLGEELLTFEEASKVCNGQAAGLVTVTNRFEQAFVSSLLYGRSGDYVWTALQDQNRTGTFRWLGGDEVTYTNWNREQPGYRKGGCVVMATGSSTGLWEVKDCDSAKAKYICRQTLGSATSPALPVPAPTPSVSGSCPQGWSSSGMLHHCYKVFHYQQVQDKLSWLQAHLFCQERGAQLLSIANFEEEQFVSQLLHDLFGSSEDHEQHWFWIGLNRRNPLDNGSWKWSDGLGFAYHNFGRHYEYDIRQCAVTDLGTMQWLPMQCESELDWICKIPKGSIVKEPEVPEDPKLKEWVTFQDAEYKFFDHHATWPQAQRICTWFGARLASIHSQQELSFLGQTIQKLFRTQDQHWWIGLHTYQNDGRFRWSDRSALNFVSWASGKPQPPGREKKCVYMTASREDWGDQKCTTDLPYVCKRSNSTSDVPVLPRPASTIPGGCPQGWSPFLSKCFRLHGQIPHERGTWMTAVAICEKQGGILATISNHLEQAFVTTLLPSVTFDLWIGLRDINNEFQWLDKEPLTYVNWAPAEPSAHRTAADVPGPTTCTVLRHGDPLQYTGFWDDRSCQDDKLGFICQRRKDVSLPSPATTCCPPDLASPLRFQNQTYWVIQKPLSWEEAVLLCESRNGTLASVRDPYQQAYLSQLVNVLDVQLWVALYSEGAQSFSWLGGHPVTYANWQDGEPERFSGCGYMGVDGKWVTTLCEAKVGGALCQNSTGLPHKFSYGGVCPHSLADSSWVPFREYCYAFHLEKLVTPKEAGKMCHRVGADLLSIKDETENLFVWEHIQSVPSQSQGAWLGLVYSPKEGNLVWPDSTAVQYVNWAQMDTNPSMLSPNTCFWILRSNGIWGLGSCTNVTLGVVCKMPRVTDPHFSRYPVQDNKTVIVVVVLATLALCLFLLAIIYLYRKRAGTRGRAFESARYSRTNCAPSEAAEKNILVSDMEMNEQPE